MEIFEQERFNLVKNLSSIKKKELDKEEHLKFALKGLQNIDCGKQLVICSNYMDACRDIQRSDTDEIRERMKMGIHHNGLIF